MAGFVKLKTSILESTIWDEAHHIRILWITMLALSDQKGIIEASVPGLAKRARLTIDEVVEGLKKLESPDKWSRTKEHEGRRIKEIDGGWFIYNYEKIRGRTSADRMREKRERDKMQCDVTLRHASHTTSQPPQPGTTRHNAADPDPEADPEENKRALSSDKEGNENQSDKTKLKSQGRKQTEQDSEVEALEEQLQWLSEKYRPIARHILESWPDCRVQNAIDIVEKGQTYLSRMPDPLAWIQEISLKRAPSDPVYDLNGRCTLHAWLIGCMAREIKSLDQKKGESEREADDPGAWQSTANLPRVR